MFKVTYFYDFIEHIYIYIYIYIFGYAVTRTDFEWIDFVKLIFNKSDLKIKWIVFEYINVKVSWMINLCIKINFRIKNYKF